VILQIAELHLIVFSLQIEFLCNHLYQLWLYVDADANGNFNNLVEKESTPESEKQQQ